MNGETIRIEYHGAVAVVKLARGVTNPLNLQLINELAEALQSARNNADVRGLVLGSSNAKFFSIGFDIPQLLDLSEEEFALFYQRFNRVCLELYTLPKPTIASITGHAIAGGCVLALCCDYRFIGEGRKLMGLNEVKLGVPVPYPADCILRHLIGLRYAREVLESGGFYEPERSLQIGMVDRVLPTEEVYAESIAKARALGASPQAAFAMIKRSRVEVIEAEILARLEEKERFFIKCWYSEAARKRLQEAREKF